MTAIGGPVFKILVTGARGPGLSEADLSVINEAQEAAEAAAIDAKSSGDIALSAGFPFARTIGDLPTPSSTNGADAGATFVIAGPFAQRALVEEITFHTLSASGTNAIARIKPTYDADKYASIGTVIVQPVTSTTTFMDIDAINSAYGEAMILEPGELLVAGSTALIAYKFGPMPYLSFPAPGALGGASIMRNYVGSDAFGTPITSAILDVRVKVKLSSIQFPRASPVLRRYDRFSQVPGGWRDPGGVASVDGAGAIVLAQAANFYDQISTQMPIGLDRYYDTFVYSPSSGSSELIVSTNPTVPTDSGQFEGSMFTIKTSTNQLLIYGRWNGGATLPPLRDTVAVTGMDGAGWLASGKKIAVRCTKKYRDLLIELTEVNGPGYFAHTVTDGGINTYTDRSAAGTTDVVSAFGNINTARGLYHGSLSIGSVGGASKLYSLQTVADYDTQLQALFVQDSLGEGFGVSPVGPSGDREIDKLGTTYGARRVAMSGIGGSNIYGHLNRSLVLLGAMAPTYFLPRPGANGGDTTDFPAGLAALNQLAINAGAISVFATIPTSASKTTQVRALTGVSIVALDTALRIGGAGGAPVDAAYQLTKPSSVVVEDGVHINALGNTRVLAQDNTDVGI